MKTVITDSITEAADFIKAGGVAAFPTETVYGLGANLFDEKAIAKVFEAKGRPADNPLIAHISDPSRIEMLSDEITDTARRFVEAFFPGPLTVVLKKSDKVPLIATAGLDTVAIRMPDFDVALTLIRKCGTPLVAPSANLSGKPSPTNWRAVKEDLEGRIECILKGQTSWFGLESTVVDCSGPRPRLLRQGAVSIEHLREIVPETEFKDASEDDDIRSPGLKYRHYSPKGEVRIIAEGATIEDSEDAAFIGLSQPKAELNRVLVCDSTQTYARSVYEFFRECDRDNILVIYCEAVDETGIGTALMDRIRRAAER